MKSINTYLKYVNLNMSPIIGDNGDISGINIKFFPKGHDHIYTTSKKSVVHSFPERLKTTGINLDIKSTVDLAMAINASISTAMFSIRRQMPNGGELNFISHSSLMNDMYLKINTTKHFFRNENLGVDKVSLSIFEDDEDFGKTELIQFSFSKKDVQIIFRSLIIFCNNVKRSGTFFIKADRIDPETKETISDINIPFAKIDDSVVFDSIWLHGQELFNLMFVVDELNYEFEIEKRLNELNGSYRQISFMNENGIMYIILKKMNSFSVEEDMLDTNKNKYWLKIPISEYLLTILSLFVSSRMLQHASDEAKEFDYESNKAFNDTKNIQYHLSTKESFIGLGYLNHKKYGEMLKFAFKVKDGVFNLEGDDGTLFDLMYEKDGVKMIVLDSAELNLFDQWSKLIETLSIVYTKSYKEFGLTSYMKKFFVSKNENGKWFRYEFVISSSLENKAAAVFVINKYKMEGKEQVLVSSFRQPLFKKYLYQLMIILLNLSESFEKSEFIMEANKKEMIKYRFKSMKTVTSLDKNEMVQYGFKKDNDIISWGIFSNNNNMHSEIEEQDQSLLNISSHFRLLRGTWLPFVGYKICVGPDKYMTDIYGEFMIEKMIGDGESWATNIYYVTS